MITAKKKRKSNRDNIRADIDKVLGKEPKTFDEFIALLKELGYEFKSGKRPSIKGKGQKRFIRFDSLGKGYSISDIMEVIAGGKKQEKTDRASVKTPYSVNNNDDTVKPLKDLYEAYQKGIGYGRWAGMFNVKQKAKALNFMRENDIDSYEELAQKADKLSKEAESIMQEIKADSKKLDEIKELKQHIINYAKANDIFKEYKASGYSKKYFEEHEEILTKRREANRYFEEWRERHQSADGTKAKLPKVKDLNTEFNNIVLRKKANYEKYRKIRDEAREMQIIKRIYEEMQGINQQQDKNQNSR